MSYHIGVVIALVSWIGAPKRSDSIAAEGLEFSGHADDSPATFDQRRRYCGRLSPQPVGGRRRTGPRQFCHTVTSFEGIDRGSRYCFRECSNRFSPERGGTSDGSHSMPSVGASRKRRGISGVEQVGLRRLLLVVVLFKASWSRTGGRAGFRRRDESGGAGQLVAGIGSRESNIAG